MKYFFIGFYFHAPAGHKAHGQTILTSKGWPSQKMILDLLREQILSEFFGVTDPAISILSVCQWSKAQMDAYLSEQ